MQDSVENLDTDMLPDSLNDSNISHFNEELERVRADLEAKQLDIKARDERITWLESRVMDLER